MLAGRLLSRLLSGTAAAQLTSTVTRSSQAAPVWNEYAAFALRASRSRQHGFSQGHVTSRFFSSSATVGATAVRLGTSCSQVSGKLAAVQGARGWWQRGLSTFAASPAVPASAPAAAAATAAFEHPLVTSAAAQRLVGWWLAGGAAWVFSMVVLGGVTRLTRSGLSMTEWKFSGEVVPRTDADWAAEFAKYQASPEFKRLNSTMGIEDFKFIFWMEFGHRQWGRALGIFFAFPLAAFAGAGALKAPLVARLGLLFCAGISQAFVGWWMVKSGLEEPPGAHDRPRVSPYRLATHLTTAFAIYCALLWTTLDVLTPRPALAGAAAAVRQAAAGARGRARGLAVLIAATAFSGAFVAGMDAGHAYNTFPLMGDSLVPDEYYSNALQPAWRNNFENTAAVQLHHRVMALTTLAAVSANWALARAAALPPAARLWTSALAAMAVGQVGLGISTLLLYVPVGLGAAHQAGALTLLSFAVALLHSLRRCPAAAAAAQQGARGVGRAGDAAAKAAGTAAAYAA